MIHFPKSHTYVSRIAFFDADWWLFWSVDIPGTTSCIAKVFAMKVSGMRLAS